jgi:amino-acid N-acetyltransferase
MNVDLRERVRAARKADLEVVRSLLRDADLPETGVDEALAEMVVLEDAGIVVAAAALERYDDAALLRSVVVAESRRGAGIARAIVADRVQHAADTGARSVYLLTTTAAGFFARLGFEAIDRGDLPRAVAGSEEFVSLCPASAVVMRRRTGAAGSTSFENGDSDERD